MSTSAEWRLVTRKGNEVVFMLSALSWYKLTNGWRMYMFASLASCRVSFEEDSLTIHEFIDPHAIHLANNDLEWRGEWPRLEGLSVGSYWPILEVKCRSVGESGEICRESRLGAFGLRLRLPACARLRRGSLQPSLSATNLFSRVVALIIRKKILIRDSSDMQKGRRCRKLNQSFLLICATHNIYFKWSFFCLLYA